MPIFDPSASSPRRAEAELLRSGLDLTGPRSSFCLMLQSDYWVRQRRASVMRASIVLTLLGLFCGSAVMMSEKPQPPPDAALALSLSETTSCLWPEDAGEIPAATRLIADADIASGAFHARGW